MKKYWKQYLTLVVLVLFASCKHGFEIITPDEVDTKYTIRYYSKPPHANDEVGYLTIENQERKYTRYNTNSEPPFTLMVLINNNAGKEAFDYILEKNNGVVLTVADLYSNGKNETAYLVESTKYFECRSFYTSEAYDGKTFILPQVNVKMKDNQDITPIEERYKGTLTPVESNGNGIYSYTCNLKTSYEILMLTNQICDTEGVEWARAVTTND